MFTSCRCRLCRLLTCPTVRLFAARLPSLMYLDTRLMTLLSGCLILTWVGGGLYEWYVSSGPLRGSVGKVVFYTPIWTLAVVLIPLGLLEIYAAIVNSRRIRRAAVFLDVFWWSWLTGLMFLDPVNVPAGLTYGVISLFRVWNFAMLNVFQARPHDRR